MVIDTSALLAILQREPERTAFLTAIQQAPVRLISTASLVETSMLVLSRSKEDGLLILAEQLQALQVRQEDLTANHVAFAVGAFRRFGKGRQPASLNLGDCFSYGLAKATGEPLLFKGDDFSKTDVERAV